MKIFNGKPLVTSNGERLTVKEWIEFLCLMSFIFSLFILSMLGLIFLNYKNYSFKGNTIDKNKEVLILEEKIKHENYYYLDDDTYKNETTYYRGVKIEFLSIKETKELGYTYKFKNKSKNLFEDTKYYIDVIKNQIDLQYTTFNLNENYFNGLKIYVCYCDEIKDGKKSYYGFYSNNDKSILLRMEDNMSSRYVLHETLAHEIGHYHFVKTISFINKKEYTEKYIKDYNKIDFYLQILNLKNEEVWENKYEEKIVEDIKSITTTDAYNSAIGDNTTDDEMNYLINVIKNNNNNKINF